MRLLLLICALLLIPIVPFVLWGSNLSNWVQQRLEHAGTPATAASLVVLLLATDIALPIPSSMVATWAGARLGWLWGTAAAFCGMSAGAVGGFLVARWIGAPLVARWIRPTDQQRWENTTERWGPVFLIAARGLPVLAEASVLLAGVKKLAWRRFLPAVLLSNLALAGGYAVLGDIASQQEWLPIAILLSGAVPVAISTYLRRRRKEIAMGRSKE